MFLGGVLGSREGQSEQAVEERKKPSEGGVVGRRWASGLHGGVEGYVAEVTKGKY